ncbi:MAG: hypothetical protein PHN85_04110, partial [Kiritimatiellae bacterium]|nr:hypothetical protein [Kiritimatiellia bacterium]
MAKAATTADSSSGGGYSFAGGTDGIMWGRDVTTQARQVDAESGSYRPRWFDNTFFQASHTHLANQNAVVRHDGMPTIGIRVGMAGGWEVASTIPNADGTVRAFPPASGIGMNDARVSAVSGGFKVAEMLIFDKALSAEECQKVEAYLNWKWFAQRAAPGVNGEAKIGWVRPVRCVAGAAVAVDQQVEVDAGDKLVISRVGGGRGVGEPGIVKTGGGKLQLDDARNFNGAIKMNGGTLTFSGKAIPTGLPRDPFLHFDASDSSSVVSSGGDLSVWRNLAADGAWKEKAICARPYDSLNAPKILADALGADLDVIDFGDLTQNSGSCYLKLVNDENEAISSANTAAPPGVATVLAVVGAQRGGGALFGATGSGNNYVTRYSSAAYCYDTTLFSSYSAGLSQSQAKNQAWIDGIPADGVNQGYLTPGYQVVAIKMPGNPTIDKIGASGALFGGLRIGEIAMYRYVLTDEQILDATAYLMKKWLNREAPGYAKFNGRKTADIQKVTAISDARIEVPEGVTARVGKLSSAGGKLIKTGGGTLEYQTMDAEAVTVEDGTFVQVARPDVSTAFKTGENSWLAEDPALHLDVANASGMEIEEVNDERRVVAWYSDDKGVMAMPPYFRGRTSYSALNYVPYLSSTVQLNGYDTLDFGPYTSANGGRSLALSRSFDSVRSAFIVWCPRDDTRGTYFGNTGNNGSLKNNSNGEFYDFLRDENATNNCPLLHINATANHVSQGEIYTNGIAVTRAAVMQPGVFTLTEFHPVAGAHISALGTDREVERLTGGIRMAEVVLYERELSDREKVATRNYLMQKWFNAAPAALPVASNE